MSAKVLDTYELLEAILHGLPTRDLLLSQRVCRTWRDVIKRSQKLQRALFRLPVSGGLLKNNYEHHPDWEHLWSYSASTSVGMQVFANPLLKPLLITMDMPLPAKLEERLPPTWTRPEASWRGMLLSQPASMVEIVKRYGADVGSREVMRAGEIPKVVDRPGSDSRRGVYFAFGAGCWSELKDNEELEMQPVEVPVREGSEDEEEEESNDGFFPGVMIRWS